MLRTRRRSEPRSLRQLAVVEIVGLLIAVFLIVSGLLAVVRPNALLVKHAYHGRAPRTTFVVVTPERARFYGVVAVVVGAPFGGWLVWGIRRFLTR